MSEVNKKNSRGEKGVKKHVGKDHTVDFSVVIPVYNSERTLESLVQRIEKVFERLQRSYEIVLTDDGSKDDSWKEIERLHEAGATIRAFHLMKNHGQHHALKCGLDQCRGRYAITMADV